MATGDAVTEYFSWEMSVGEYDDDSYWTVWVEGFIVQKNGGGGWGDGGGGGG